MAFKLAFIVALCISPGFALKPCKKPISESAEAIPHELEETIHEIDDMSETISIAAMEAYFEGKDHEVIVACFEEQKEDYSELGQKIAGMMRQAYYDMAKFLREKYVKYYQRIEFPLETMAETMSSLPGKMWVHIQSKEFSKAMEAMREAKEIIEEKSKILGEAMTELDEDDPEAAKKAEEIALEIRSAARDGCRAIAEAFRNCVEEGGPRKPIEHNAQYQLDLDELYDE